MDDPGWLALFGKSTGARNLPALDWVKNIVGSVASADIEKNDLELSATFALFWNMACSIVPPGLIEDYKQFLDTLGMCRMDAHGQMSYDHDTGRGDYMVDVGLHQYTFHSEELAPPTGIIGENYSW